MSNSSVLSFEKLTRMYIVQRESVKLSKDNHHGYINTNIKTLGATKKKSKFYQHIYIKYLCMRIVTKKYGMQAHNL